MYEPNLGRKTEIKHKEKLGVKNCSVDLHSIFPKFTLILDGISPIITKMYSKNPTRPGTSAGFLNKSFQSTTRNENTRIYGCSMNFSHIFSRPISKQTYHRTRNKSVPSYSIINSSKNKPKFNVFNNSIKSENNPLKLKATKKKCCTTLSIGQVLFSEVDDYIKKNYATTTDFSKLT